MPLIATNCIRNEALYPTYDNVRYVSPETFKTWFRGHPKPGDILFVNKGTPGRVCMVPDPVDFCIAQDMVALRADPSVVYPPYLFAVLRSPQAQDAIERMHVGTLIPHFKKGDFDKLLLPIPKNRKAQEFIGDCYLNLSAKIDLNRKQARVMEGIARAVFTSWFVNFDPVRRPPHAPNPAAGQPTVFPPDLAARFPKRLVDSPIGEVPEGWRVEGIDANIKFLNGLALQKFPPANGRSLPVIKIAQLRKGDTDGADRASADLDAEYIVQDGDVLFSWSGSLECVLWAGGPGALNQHLFKVTAATLPKWFYYLWVHQHLPDFRHIAAGKATTMGHIQRHHLTQALVTVPTDERLMRAMDRFFAPLIDSLTVRAVQSRTLAALRDALLPKLIAGELRINDAEKVVGGAV
ncbi:hypothetical protein PHYC_03844 [Phycisphaerales bacterium]|nr:hypothetical protein PHYC_03844 [Phycisphaerales bacterium]